MYLLGAFTILLVGHVFAQDICERKYKKIACYQEDENAETLFNDRSKINWKNFPDFIRKLACKCDKAAKSKGYKYFAIRYFGICVGIKKVGVKYDRGIGDCRNTNFKPCALDAPGECVGREWMDMTYEIGRDGGYSKWSSYGTCSATCGSGTHQRTRKCDNPTPIANGNKCDVLGPAVETKECKVDTVCPVDGKYGDWSVYGACSASCGGGVQKKTRKCDSPAPAGAGKDCEGPSEETKVCGTGVCSVDGGFGEWSRWESCSKTCGGGTASRKRLCNNPTPAGGGKDCEGERVQSKGCANDFCPGPKGVAKAEELVEKFLKNFHEAEYPDKKPSGKFYKAIFDIQKAVAEEFISVDPSAKGKTAEERLKELEEFLKVATEGGSIDFARTTLGKGLYVFMKKKIKDGLPIDDIDKAASGYLDKLKETVGEQNWNQVISSQGDSTLMFTMDTTGSMADEIRASKAIARSIIDATRDFKVDYILSPFNDPRTGPVTYKSEKDRAGFISDINRLRAAGGGDCPELAFKGMLNALDKGPKYGSPMFVFTDATAKDDNAANMAALKSAADMNSATITFFTNLNGCGGAKGGIKSYHEIAEYTSGQVFPLKNEAELLKFKDYVASSLSRDTMIASGGSLKGKTKRSLADGQYSFNVDDGIKKLIVSIATSNPNTASSVTLVDPSNDNVAAKNTMSMIRIFEVDAPQAGNWRLNFPSSVGKHKYSVDGVSKDAIEFAHNFMYQENPRRNSPPISLYHPIKGKNNMLIVRLGGLHRIDVDTLRVFLHDSSGAALKSDIKLANMDSDEVFTADITPPDVSFQVKLAGKTKSGVSFERISRGVSQATDVFLRPLYAGNEFTIKLGARGTNVQMQVLNFGSEASFTFSGVAQRGGFGSSTTKTIRRSGYAGLTYNAPSGLKSGSTDRLSVSAVNKATGEKTTAVFNVMLV